MRLPHCAARALTLSLLILIISTAALAQKYEVHPYVGGFFPEVWVGEAIMKSAAFCGLRAGIIVTPTFQVDGNFGYFNHFEFKGTDRANRAVIWDVNGSYTITTEKTEIVDGFVTGGVGGVTASVRGHNSQLLLDATDLDPNLELRRITLEDGDTFFIFNFGAGVKKSRMWGPLGWRVDARSRIMPNFFGRVNSWLDVSGGITFSWGSGKAF